jgi:fatty acid desaturase
MQKDGQENPSPIIGQAAVSSTPPPLSLPRLWNPNAAACWSLLFTPAFGAWLHARNAETLERAAEAKANWVWFYASIAYLGVVVVTLFIPALPDAVFRGASIGILVGWYFSLGKKQVQHVKGTFQDGYERKSWTRPLLIAFGCLCGYFVGLFIIAIVVDSILGSQ